MHNIPHPHTHVMTVVFSLSASLHTNFLASVEADSTLMIGGFTSPVHIDIIPYVLNYMCVLIV